MKIEQYEKVWNKIRSSNISESDAILCAGYGKNKYKICDYFLNNKYLNSFYVKKRSVKTIANEMGLTELEVQSRIATEVGVLKVRLAENGLVDQISFEEDANYYSYIINRISKKGTLFVNVGDEISVKDISKALRIGESGIKAVIKRDKESIKEILKQNGIRGTDRCVRFFARIFGDFYKNCKNVPVNYIEYFDKKIRNNSLLEGYIYKNFKYSDVYMTKCLELVENVESDIKDFLKGVNKRKNRRI